MISTMFNHNVKNKLYLLKVNFHSNFNSRNIKNILNLQSV
jgi:hypothetical protein